jgi:hypothetical protein
MGLSKVRFRRMSRSSGNTLRGAGESFPCRGVSTGAAPLKVLFLILFFKRPCEDTIGSTKDSSPTDVAAPPILAGASGGKGAAPPISAQEQRSGRRSSRSRRQSRRFLQKIGALESLIVSVGFADARGELPHLWKPSSGNRGQAPFPPTPLRGSVILRRSARGESFVVRVVSSQGRKNQNQDLEGRCPGRNTPAGE